MSDNLAPELVERIEEIVARRLREELDARAQLVTIDQFTQAMERMDRRFEELTLEVSRGFQVSDQRFEAMQGQMDQRFEAMQGQMDQRFEAMQAHMDQGFEESREHFNEVMQVVLDIRSQLGASFEAFARNVVHRILEGEGWPEVSLKKRRFHDPEHLVSPDSEDVEIDGFSENPPIIVESTSILRHRQKVEDFLRKKELIENLEGQSFRGFFVASGSELSPDEMGDIIALLRRNQCELLNL
jgi:hypothetical protein